MNSYWLIAHLLTSIGFILALAFLSHILRERRSPTSTLAWLMAIIFFPYIGVPLYLIFGGRKMIRKAEAKPNLSFDASKDCAGLRIGSAYPFEPGNGIFPPCTNNRITFLTEGEQAFQTIINLIHDARDTIHIATFILMNSCWKPYTSPDTGVSTYPSSFPKDPIIVWRTWHAKGT